MWDEDDVVENGTIINKGHTKTSAIVFFLWRPSRQPVYTHIQQDDSRSDTMCVHMWCGPEEPHLCVVPREGGEGDRFQRKISTYE